VVQRRRARGHDHRARREVLDLDLARQPLEIAAAECVERGLGAEEVGEFLHLTLRSAAGPGGRRALVTVNSWPEHRGGIGAGGSWHQHAH
jgi:hypothetical protein